MIALLIVGALLMCAGVLGVRPLGLASFVC